MAILKTPQRWRQWFYLALGTAVTVVLLAWALRDISLIAVWQALRQADWRWLGLGWLAYIGCYWLRAWRWQTLLADQGTTGRFKTYLAANFIGFGASCLLPGYAGEVIRAAIPAKLEQMPFAATFSSLFAERILDLMVVFLYLLMPFGLNAVPVAALQQLPLGWIGAAILLIWLVLVLAASCPELITKAVTALLQTLPISRPFQQLQDQAILNLRHFLDGLSALRQPRRSLVALGQTLLIWGLNAVTYAAVLLALGIHAPGWLGALFIQSATALALVLPSTPGYVGAFEAGVRFSLGVYGVPIDLTLAGAVALRFLMYVTIPCIALIVAARLGLSGADLLSMQRPRQ